EKPAYMHSFAMSEKYIILTEHPLLVNEIDMLTMGFRDTAIIDSFNWTPSNGTRIIIVERESGKTIHEIKTDTFFTFHHLNAFDDGDDLIVDIAIYDDWSIIDELYMNTLKSDKGALTQTSIPYRFKIDIKTGTLEKSKIVDEKIELPVINFFKNSGKKYSFVYGVGNNKNLPPDFLNQLIKIDVETKEIKYWNPKNHYPQEPFFVPKPNGKEDEGVVLSVVADGEKGKSFLLILDAESFTEIGRAYLPHVVPFGLHGIFVPK
ncbi:MAG: carotenoid oxygenase family protein, partial [Leptospiraceae bacterium]|nr:carotenoid oxygenase family protein [Leptospiraceae bacterium]